MADLFRLLPIFQMYYDTSLDFPQQMLVPSDDGIDLVEFETSGPVFPTDHADGDEWDLTKTDDSTFGEWFEIDDAIALLKAFTASPKSDWFWYGMIHPDVGGDWNGVAHGGVASGRFGYDVDDDSPWVVTYGTTIAHELAHVFMVGSDHINCKGTEESGGGLDETYPYQNPDCSMAAVDPEGYMGFDVYSSLYADITGGPTVIDNDPAAPTPRRGFPFMSYQNPRWSDPWDYCKMLDGLGVSCDHTAINIRVPTWTDDVMVSTDPGHVHASSSLLPRKQPAGASAQRPSQAGIRPILISAAIDTARSRAEFQAVVQQPDASAAQLDKSRQRLAQMAGGQSPAALVFVDAGGKELSRYALSSLDGVPHESEGLAPTAFGLTEWFDLPDAAAAIRIEINGRVVEERRASANAPTVKFETPTGGKLSAPLTLRWTANDTDGDDLVATLLFSGDDGETWQAVSSRLPGNEVTLGSLSFLGGTKEGRFKIMVSDGFHTAEAVTEKKIEIPNAAPRPAIIGPRDGGIFPRGATVVLQGTAFDVEDLGLDGDRLTWTSNLDGSLGKGSEIITEDLQPGVHTIKLTAKDKNGATASAEIKITIEGGAAPEHFSKDEEKAIRKALGAPSGSDSKAVWFLAGGAIAGIGAGALGAALWSRRKPKAA